MLIFLAISIKTYHMLSIFLLRQQPLLMKTTAPTWNRHIDTTNTNTLTEWSKFIRLNTIPQTAFLVSMGAVQETQSVQSLYSVLKTKEFLSTAYATTLTTVAANIVNDYQDRFRDKRKQKHNLHERALPILCTLYMKIFLITTCSISSTSTKNTIYIANAVLLCYTNYLKPVTGIKNVVCATTVAMAIGVGAFSVHDTLQSVQHLMLRVFGSIWHREILMDIRDIHDDQESNIQTLPVTLGIRKAIVFSMLPLCLSFLPTTNSLSCIFSSLSQLAVALSLFVTMSNLDFVIESNPYFLLLSLIFMTQ